LNFTTGVKKRIKLTDIIHVCKMDCIIIRSQL
jgi:hypothetical protein